MIILNNNNCSNNYNTFNIEICLYKNINMKLIYIKSTMETKNYSIIRSILKKEQGEKIAPYIFKLTETKTLQAYLDKERIPMKFIKRKEFSKECMKILVKNQERKEN